jgi:hypothetical protein
MQLRGMRSPWYAVALVSVLGCKSDLLTPEQAPAAAAPAQPKARSNIVKVQTLVPYGKKLACDRLLTPARVGELIGDQVTLRDRSTSNAEAAAVCAVMRAGEPPKNDAQLRQFQKSMKLGVLPGDEYCTITLFCAYPATPEEFTRKCESRGDSGNQALGVFACVHQSQRADQWAYTYKVIDSDTQCVVEVMGGPSVTDEPLVQNCTRAALEVTPEQIKAAM